MGLFKPNIQKMQKKRDVPGLIRALNDKDFFIRDVAAKALTQIGDIQAIKPLVDALKDKNRNMRWSAATSLGKLGVGGVEQLISCLKDDDPEVRKASAKSLGLIGEAKAVEPLAHLLNDKDKNVVKAAAESLEKMGDKRGKQAMIAFREEIETSSSKTFAQTRPEVPLTPGPGTFIDERDHKVYKTVKIGNQIWMAENLAYKANSGCLAYNNDERNVSKYGYLYNWEIACKVAPQGWHLPNLEEFETLLKKIGNSKKEIIHGGNSGFSALFGGSFDSGVYKNIDEAAYFWTSTPYNPNEGYLCMIAKDLDMMGMFDSIRSCCFSVRCLQDK